MRISDWSSDVCSSDLRRQPRLQRGDWGSPEKSEGNGAVLRLHRMMEPMRLDDAAHIGRTRQIAVADPLEDEHVVETEIDRAIGSDAAAHPCPGVAPAKPHAREEAEDRGYGEHYGEPVVFLEQAVARLVVPQIGRAN